MKPSGDPYRLPCESWDTTALVKEILGCSQHVREADRTIPESINTTLVPGYAAPNTYIPPYTRRESVGASPPCGTADSIPCGEWFPVPANTYAATGLPVDMSVCFKRGFKAVKAQKFWQGRFDFNYCDGDAIPTTKYRTVRVKYRSYHWSGSSCADATNGSYGTKYYDATQDFQVTIDANSGEIILDFSTESVAVDTSSIHTPFVLSSAMNAYANLGCLSAHNTDWNDHTCPANPLQTLVRGGGGFSADCYFKYTSNGWGGERFGFEVEAWLSNPYTLADCYTAWCALQDKWPLQSDTVYPWRTDQHVSIVPLVTRNETVTTSISVVKPTMDNYAAPTAGSGTVADPYTAWEQRAWKDLSAWQWVWHSGPSAGGTPSTPQHSSDCTLELRYDGLILGAPAETSGALLAGVDKVFDFRCIKYQEGYTVNCYDNPTLDGRGVWNSDVRSAGAQIPKCSTQWTPCGDLTKARAWLEVTTAGIVGQKYCEIKDAWPSQNLFRPSGYDRAKTDKDLNLIWPKAWGITGRDSVLTAVQSGGNINCTLPAVLYWPNSRSWPSRVLKVNDYVRFSGALAALGDVQITATNGTTSFTIVGTLSGTYSTGGFVMGARLDGDGGLTGLPHYAWADNGYKGNFVFSLEIDAVLTTQTGCFSYYPCDVSVMLATPEGNHDAEPGNWPASVSIVSVFHPTTVALGLVWKFQPHQVMVDRLFVARQSCTSEAGCEDGFFDIDCVQDDDSIERLCEQPYVEAFTQYYFEHGLFLADGATHPPAFPSGAAAPFTGGISLPTFAIGTGVMAWRDDQPVDPDDTVTWPGL